MATLTIDNSNGLTCASLREAAPTTNGLGGTAKEVGAYTTGDRRHWLFDFGAAPSLGGLVTFSAAALSLTVADNMGVTTTDFDVFLLSAPTANTAQATWNERATGVPWGTAGALGAGDVSLTALASISDVVFPTRYAFTSAAFALAVQNWCNGVTAGLQVLMCRNPDTAYDLTSTEFWSTGAGAPTWPELTGTYTLGGGAATVSTITGTTATEASSVVFTVTMSGTGGLTGAYSWSGTATSADYTTTLTDGMFTTTGGSGSVTVSGGNIVVPSAVTAFEVAVPTTTDTLDEADETIRLVFGGVTSSSGTITDDDAPPTITGTTSQTVTAGSPIVITYSPGLSGQSRTYTLALTDGTAVGGTDYDNTTVTGDFAVTAGTGSVSISGSTVTVDPGVTEFTLTIGTTA